MLKQSLLGALAVLVLCTAASAQSADLAELVRENNQLKDENARLKAENEQTKRRIEELRKRAADQGIKAVAVVDVVSAFNSLIEKTEFDADFKGKGDDAIAEDRKKRERIDILRTRMEEAVIGSDEYKQKQQELDDAILEHQLWLSGEQGRLLRRRATRMEEIYNKMMDAVALVAREKGYDQVMLKEPEVSFIGSRPDQVAALIRSRKILWSSPDLNITDDVVKLMNDQYVNSKRGN